MSDEIVRKLTSHESLLDNGHEQFGAGLNPRVFIIDSIFDLVEFKNSVKEAIKIWTGLHPLLRWKIMKKKIDVDGELLIRYFAFADKEMIDSLKNVAFLKFEGGEFCDRKWQLLYEDQFFRPFDSTNGPLWRFMFLQLPSSFPEFFKYCVLFNAHHAITDGTNAYAIISELFSIFEHVQTSIHLQIDSDRKQLIHFEREYPNDPRYMEKTNGFYYEHPSENPTEILIPKYIKQNIVFHPHDHIDENGLFRTHDGDVYMTVNEIMKRRPENNTAIKLVSIDSNRFKSLLNKTKKMKVKLTGCFEAIIAIALQRVYRDFSKDQNYLLECPYYVSLNLRQFLNNQLDSRVMGVWATQYRNLLTNIPDSKDDELFWSSKFWQVVKERTDALHEYIEKRTYFDKTFREFLGKVYYKLEKGYRVKDVSGLYAITNIGAKSSTAPNSLGKIYIREYYSGLSYIETDTWSGVFHSIASIDNHLFWCISYNKRLFSEQTIDYWVKCISEIVSLITKYSE